jgi:EpsI family protein
LSGRALVLAALLAAGALSIRTASTVEAVPLRRSLDGLPASLGSWSSVGDMPLDRATLDVLRADDYVNRVYVADGIPAELFVAYYASQRQGDTMHSPMNCLPAAGWQPLSTGRIDVRLGGGESVRANRYVIQKGLDERLVLYWYQSHGRTVASEYASKAYLIFDSLRLRRSDAALVRVVVPHRPGAEESAIGFVRALHPVLDDYIPK